MKKLCVWALAAMMTVGATGAMADHLDDIKAKGGNIPAALYEQLDKLEDRIKKAAK